jgi:sterol desaturase/sphingolipid hydroxylase (fatty acid hydroxylase superfamily)
LKPTNLAARPGIWRRSHYLNRMTLPELVRAYFQYYAIQAYLVLAALSGVVAYEHPIGIGRSLGVVAAAIMLYPLVWYVLHRWVLHGRWLFKSRFTAAVWKRIHYDHHQDPNHLEVLFGALYTTLPAVAAATIPVGWLIGGIGGAALAFGTGLLTTCFYEFCHCVQHLSYKPKAKWLADIKARHMAHHFHDEKGNYGITSFVWDKLFRTYYERQERATKSPTVFNLGYTSEVAERYPWVAQLSGGVASDHPRARMKAGR